MPLQKHTLHKIRTIVNVIPILCWSETAMYVTSKELWWIKRIKASTCTKTTRNMTVNTFGANSSDGINKLSNNQTHLLALIEEVLFQFLISFRLWIMIVLLSQVLSELKGKARDKTLKKSPFQQQEVERGQERMLVLMHCHLFSRRFHHFRHLKR